MRRGSAASLSFASERARLVPLIRRRLWIRVARSLLAAARTTEGRSSSTKLSSAAEKRGTAGGRGRVGFLSQLRSSSMGYHRASASSLNPDCGSVSATLRSPYADFECQGVRVSRRACAYSLRQWLICVLVVPAQTARNWRVRFVSSLTPRTQCVSDQGQHAEAHPAVATLGKAHVRREQGYE